jgi:23S rRNA (adenine2030-N6)-methyltransferase
MAQCGTPVSTVHRQSMLAYRHAFHAGNHADVLKHIVLLRLLRHMNLKDKGYRLVDTHAGAGLYALDSPQAQKKGEYLQGIARLWSRDDAPEGVADYLQCVRELNAGGALQQYPGSPMLARRWLRPQDQLRLFELHPAEHQALQALFGAERGIEIRQADGFAALKGQLPPTTRRALVLVDPSYEGHGDYPLVLDTIRHALRRFAEGVYMVWYPVVNKPGAAAMVQGLKTLAPKGWLHARLTLQPTDAMGFGLAGSGIVVINPPYTLHAQLQAVLPWLCLAMAQHAGAAHLLEQQAA